MTINANREKMEMETIKTDIGRTLEIKEILGNGGQGKTYLARDATTGTKGVVKLFHLGPKTDKKNQVNRIKKLVELNLSKQSTVYCAPVESITSSGSIGHYAHFVEGSGLEDLVSKPPVPGEFPKRMQIAIGVAHAVKRLHEQNFVHGDLHMDNIRYVESGDVLRFSVIDFDNYRHVDAPLPQMAGQPFYMAPELHNGTIGLPDQFTERFSLACILHEIFMSRHPAVGSSSDAKEERHAIENGIWLADPIRLNLKMEDGSKGFTPNIMNLQLISLFRRSFKKIREDRPTPSEWVDALKHAARDIHACENCGFHVLGTHTLECPVCRNAYPNCRIRERESGVIIEISNAATPLGRSNFPEGTAQYLSQPHAIFRKMGPTTYIEPVGQNNTFISQSGKWEKLQNNVKTPIEKGSVLKLADKIIYIE